MLFRLFSVSGLFSFTNMILTETKILLAFADYERRKANHWFFSACYFVLLAFVQAVFAQSMALELPRDKEAEAIAVAREAEARVGYTYIPPMVSGVLRGKLTPRIRFADYVRQVKNLDLDPWQENFCDRLQNAFFNRDAAAMRAAIAVMPQAGKSVIISQAFPAYILGHDPFHRIVLACYNLTRSRKHGQGILACMRSDAHRRIFPEMEGMLPRVCSDKAFSTLGRLANYDGQDSFTAASLNAGLTGIGFDTLIIDDPYNGYSEALSPVIRENVWNFYTGTAQMRGGDHGNIFVMFHRYHQDDLGGRILATGEFEYWHYDAQYVGDYVDEETGIAYPDAFPREMGEYLTKRRSPAFFERQKRDPQVWNSQFQQRPTGEDGNMFDVRRIVELEREPDPSEFLFIARSWDNAYTEDAGDYTVGMKQGIRPDGSVHIFDVKRERLNSGARVEFQERTAEEDGKLVFITHPVDPAAGKDVAFQFEQRMTEKGYTVELMPTGESKPIRAHPMSVAVNQGRYSAPKNAPWLSELKKELKYFPNSTHKDQADAGGDGYRKLYEKLRRGRVIKTYDERRNLLSWSAFARRFGKRIPFSWEIYAAIKVSNDNSKPSGAVLVARAAENAYIGEAVFVLAAYKQLSGSFSSVVEWLKKAIDYFVAKETVDGVEKTKKVPLLWMSDKSSDEIRAAVKGLRVRLAMYDGDIETGIPETNWYFSEEPKQKHPFYENETGTHCYLMCADRQMSAPENELGMISLRQEFSSWTYNEKSEPQTFGGTVSECLKMILTDFKPRAIKLTNYEKAQAAIEEHFPTLTTDAIAGAENEQIRQQKRLQRSMKLDNIMNDLDKPDRPDDDFTNWLEQTGQI
jgi:predicted phage terminase large subunit-like protein